MGSNLCNCKNRENAKTEFQIVIFKNNLQESNLENKENNKLSTIDSNYTNVNNKEFKTINSEDNTRDNSVSMKAKANIKNFFDKKDNLAILIKMQKCVKKFLKTNPRIVHKKNYFGNNNKSNIIINSNNNSNNVIKINKSDSSKSRK